MAWRPPKRVFVLARWIEIRQVDQATLRDHFADDPDQHLWGGWDGDDTIYLLRTASPLQKNRTYWHEIMHCLVDTFDP